MRPPSARPLAALARNLVRQPHSGTQLPSSGLASRPPRSGHARSGLREILGVFFATLLLIGAPALAMVEELRDPACAFAAEGEREGKPFRSLTVEGHRISQCLGDFPEVQAEERLALARGAMRALPDPTW